MCSSQSDGRSVSAPCWIIPSRRALFAATSAGAVDTCGHGHPHVLGAAASINIAPRAAVVPRFRCRGSKRPGDGVPETSPTRSE